MAPARGWIVRSLAGHDKGMLLCVLEEREGDLLLCDGARRKTAAPKRKKIRQVAVEDAGAFRHPALGRLRLGEEISDRALRQALAAFRDSRKGSELHTT